MFERVCLVHYHELGLKGRNRAVFEHRLVDNLKAVLSPYAVSDVRRISGHLLVEVTSEEQIEDIAALIRQTPGVARCSVGWRTARTMDDINRAAALALAGCEPCASFKVIARRSNTDFPIDSMQLNRDVGSYLHEVAPDKAIIMRDPDAKVHVDVVQGSAYVYAESDPGVGGLPVGSSGKVCCLLSGGIDSPVATWRLMRRGAVAVGVHFSGRPETSASSEEIVDQLADALAPAAGLGRVYVVPFGSYQRQIAATCDPDLRVILYRRLMFAVAERIARIEHAKALATGESLGQVASQTLDNIAAVDPVVSMPVLRPLIGNDKQEIIAEARKLRTYDISVQDHADCCTLFMPRNPETHARLDRVLEAWEALPHDEWVERILDEVEWRTYPCPAYRPPRRWRQPVRTSADVQAAEG